MAVAVTGGWVAQHRSVIAAVSDAAAWVVAICLAALLRVDFAPVAWGWLVVIGLFAAGAQLVVGSFVGLYIGRWVVGSFEEVQAVAQAAVASTLVAFAADQVLGDVVARSAVIGGGIVVLVLALASRFAYRKLVETRPAHSDVEPRQRLLVFGAGEAAYAVVRSLQLESTGEYVAVAVLDDDVRLRHRRVHGLPVVGTRRDLAAAAERHRADALLIALPSAGAALISELTRLGTEAGLAVKTVPSIAQIIGTDAEVVDIRDVTEEDLLGRHRIETDIDSIAQYVTGRRVLVTGAGGSIGSELCRQLHRFAPSELIMVDRDESALHAVQMSIHGRALLDSDDLVLIDIRDRIGLNRLFFNRRPEVVFHAAALKHLPLLERHPVEAIKTNVWGTLALLETAAASGVARFVNISTDKAASPASVLGYSKRICERLTAHFAAETGRPFLSVRFGNVLGSRGSVLVAFREQVANGGPITVTHPEVTRYFMTVEEAVQLVIQAGAIGRGGEALVLDMGRPVRIADVARMLAERAPRPVEIVYTGLRPGEKLQEDLLAGDELDSRPFHPMISHVVVPGIEPELVQAFDPAEPPESIVSLLKSLCDQRSHGQPVDLRLGEPVDLRLGEPVDLRLGEPVDLRLGEPLGLRRLT